ncbi:unnamed protein product [Durusdinium trenchii]|uniref:Uncharacterized protein n=2 Tax=Durusdinium trenchii TaxID=1381693 RepID=A0ABP0HY29_9DINO
MGIDEGSAAGFGADSTVIAVKTPGGRWQFVLQRPQTPAPADHGDATVMVQSLHRGDATDAQEKTFMGGLETDLLHFTESCFQKSPVDTSNLGSLQGSLGGAIQCVLDKCQEKWGWKPELSGSGSDNGGPYDVYGLGATVIGAETAGGKWQFIVRLKF